jgi:hypothetical protein
MGFQRMAIRKKTCPRRGIRVRSVDEPPYEVDAARLKRFDQRNLIFNRASGDPHWEGYRRTEEQQGLKNIAEGSRDTLGSTTPSRRLRGRSTMSGPRPSAGSASQGPGGPASWGTSGTGSLSTWRTSPR